MDTKKDMEEMYQKSESVEYDAHKEAVICGGLVRCGMSMHLEPADSLEHMLKLQRWLQERMGYDFEKMTVADRTEFVKEFTLHAEDELHEVLRELPYFKPWKRYDNWSEEKTEDQLEKAKDEFIDVIHFVLNIALGLGMTAEDIYEGYLVKNGINHDRQDDTTHYKGVE